MFNLLDLNPFPKSKTQVSGTRSITNARTRRFIKAKHIDIAKRSDDELNEFLKNVYMPQVTRLPPPPLLSSSKVATSASAKTQNKMLSRVASPLTECG